MTDGWAPVCVICAFVLGRRAESAVTLVAGDAVCADHLALRVDCESLLHAVREARADLGIEGRTDVR